LNLVEYAEVELVLGGKSRETRTAMQRIEDVLDVEFNAAYSQE